jgi:predicted nucleic acid-binding Zn ribbon protein
MRRSNTQPLSDILREYIREMRMENKLKETSVVQSWESVMGKTIARYTTNIYISKGVLFVEISSSVVKNELVMLREEIRTRLNESAGEEMITSIVFK